MPLHRPHQQYAGLTLAPTNGMIRLEATVDDEVKLVNSSSNQLEEFAGENLRNLQLREVPLS